MILRGRMDRWGGVGWTMDGMRWHGMACWSVLGVFKGLFWRGFFAFSLRGLFCYFVFLSFFFLLKNVLRARSTPGSNLLSFSLSYRDLFLSLSLSVSLSLSLFTHRSLCTEHLYTTAAATSSHTLPPFPSPSPLFPCAK